ncbi:fibronectin type III domain-containing protein [Comamonas sp. JUb58]|uniref:fibronectin type III domain-containing protein n=1 Tax=Comamonas sp. JUb58 TaxID=2485114 RepID=UPI00105CDC7D|nr:fibronectin type III domain-containing protein [Comamonas sp. JUb58]TDS73430.1 putative Ig domain-containing protein [Comamonas sp. JUb58]
MRQIKSQPMLAVGSVKTIAKNALLIAAFAASAASAQTYVGSFKVHDGPPHPSAPTVYSALEVAAMLFGGVPSDYAISVNPNTTDPSTITHSAHYSPYGYACAIFDENARIDTGAPGYTSGDLSAYVRDNCGNGETNYVWRLAATAPATAPSPTITDTGDSRVNISWTAPANNGSPITKYTVTGVPAGSCTTEVVAPATEPATSCTITGLTNGTPYKFTVVATNAIGDSVASPESAEAIPSADIMFVGGGPTITLAGGVVAAPYSQTLQVTGGLPPYTFSYLGDLPPGLSLDSATGVVSGTPTTPGSYTFSVGVADTVGTVGVVLKAVHVAEQTFTIVITAAPVIQAKPVPALGGVGLLLLSGAVAGSMGVMRRRKSK